MGGQNDIVDGPMEQILDGWTMMNIAEMIMIIEQTQDERDKMNIAEAIINRYRMGGGGTALKMNTQRQEGVCSNAQCQCACVNTVPHGAVSPLGMDMK